MSYIIHKKATKCRKTLRADRFSPPLNGFDGTRRLNERDGRQQGRVYTKHRRRFYFTFSLNVIR